MDGSAVTTTRVSSATMKYATEVSSTVRTLAEAPESGCSPRTAAARSASVMIVLHPVRLNVSER